MNTEADEPTKISRKLFWLLVTGVVVYAAVVFIFIF